jgi:hypothetical protein
MRPPTEDAPMDELLCGCKDGIDLRSFDGAPEWVWGNCIQDCQSYVQGDFRNLEVFGFTSAGSFDFSHEYFNIFNYTIDNVKVYVKIHS